MTSEDSDPPQRNRRSFQDDVRKAWKMISKEWKADHVETGEHEDMGQLLKKYKESTGNAHMGQFSVHASASKEVNTMFGISR